MFNFLKGTTRQVKLWAFFAGTLPIVVLSFLALSYFVGWDSFYHKAIIIGSGTFFFVAVVWWWWALYKIADLAIVMNNTTEKFDSVRQDIQEIKKDLKV
jgi:uncharacterized membrane protein YqjE